METRIPKWQVWTGRALSWSAILFLAPNMVIKLIDHPIVQEIMTRLGWPVHYDRLIGVIELACLVLYAIPRTSTLGMILTTGLIGGAIATNLRAEQPLFSHILFGVYLGVWMWAGLWLRDARLRSMIPLRR
ncbi:MAG: DoxX family protein [Caulobacter sp.]|jgi:hypothetical protein|nr:DoxX family protein [Caulobacter sp.]